MVKFRCYTFIFNIFSLEFFYFYFHLCLLLLQVNRVFYSCRAPYIPYPTGKMSRGSWNLLIFMTRITSLS